MKLLLRRLRWWSKGESGGGDLRLAGGLIVERGSGLASRGGERAIDCRGLLALPGLINCHDHLDLDLLPPLGDPPYRSFYDWAEEIYRPQESPLREVLAVARRDRLVWGGIKNLISGATTVVHHDPPHPVLSSGRFPLRVETTAWSHSLGFAEAPERDLEAAGGRPWVIHAAEGVDRRAEAEIDELDARGLLQSSTVIVHGVAATAVQLRKLAERGCGLVWCPASNLRLFGRTAPVDRLSGKVCLGLGTDSTISGSPTLLDEIRVAADCELLAGEDLLAAVTHRAADLFRLEDGRGTLEPGAVADLLLLPDRGDSPTEALLRSHPADIALVLIAGAPRLAGRGLAAELDCGAGRCSVDGRAVWLASDLESLQARIRDGVSDNVLGENPLWKRLGTASVAGAAE